MDDVDNTNNKDDTAPRHRVTGAPSESSPGPGHGRSLTAPDAIVSFFRTLPRTYAWLLALVATLAVGLALSWAGLRDYRNFQHYQRQIMERSVTGVANEIGYLIENYHTSLQIFAERHATLLERLLDNPRDDAAHQQISQDLARHFPGYLSFTIANAQGELLYDDLGENIGELCRADIQSFVSRQHNSDIYIHPGPQEYHVDIMIPWAFRKNKSGVFFVSFKPQVFARVLANSHVVDHQLFLIRRDASDLIEIASEGSRVDLAREIRLTPDELQRVGFTKAVAGTRWTLVDVPATALYGDRLREIVVNGVISFAAFLLVAGVLIVLIYREDLRRTAVQQALHASHAELGLRVKEHTQELRAANERLKREIHEHRRTEKALLAANEMLTQEAIERDLTEQQMKKLASVVEQTDDIVMITDRDGTIEYVNPAFEQLTGFSREEVLGATPSLLRSGLQGEEFFRQMWETITAGHTYRDVFVNRNKTGSIFYEQKTITPVKDEAGGISHFVSTGKDITEQMETQKRLQYLAHHDPLTGLPNRALLSDRLAHAMTQAQRNDRLLAVMFLDLDRFKTINDSLGHATGDELLKLVAERLTTCLRRGDTIARLGGDEFALVLESLPHVDGATSVAEKILRTMEQPFFVHGRELFISTSIGITVYPFDNEEMEGLLKNADAAMYRAKERGRNGYQFFAHDMMDRAVERLELESTLRHALQREQFVLHYQPRVRVDTGEVLGMEALLRWNHPERGLVPPDKFIPLLEDTGLIVPVGEWVLQQACHFNRHMRAAGLPPVRVAVNLSARQFRDPALLDTVTAAMRTAELDPQLLELEITESLLMENIDSTRATLKALRDMGVHISLDDFGTGYSAIAYLKRFTISGIKIDRSFVRDLMADADDAALVKAIVAMARAMRLNVTAEGVETEQQLGFLRAHGCHEAQGYFFARPAPPEVIRDWWQQRGAAADARRRASGRPRSDRDTAGPSVRRRHA